MDMKWTMVAVLCIAFGIRTSGQTTTTYETGMGHGTPLIPTVHSELPNTLPAVAVTWDYYAQPKTLIVHALNNSGKDITGYTILIRHKNADGTIDKGGRTEYTSDMLSVLITTEIAKDPAASERTRLENTGNGLFPAGNGIFVAGETRDMTLPGINSGSELDITAGVVFYTDGTYEEQDKGALKRMIANRQRDLLVMKKVNEASENALADPTNDHPIAAAITELTKAAIEAATHKPDGAYDAAQGLQWPLQNAMQNLSNMQGQQGGRTERERLKQYVEEQAKRVELMTPHCHLEIALK
jgi:hypothetical protein